MAANKVRVKALKWNDSDPNAVIALYRRLLNKIRDTADKTLDGDHQQELMRLFFARLPLDGMLDILGIHSYKRLYRMFFEDWLLLDYRSKRGSPTMAELTLHQMQGDMDSQEKQALTSLIKSQVAPYKVTGIEENLIRVENPMIAKSHYKVISAPDDLMLGDFLITRLLPGPVDWLLLEPWILLMPRDRKMFTNSLRQAMKEAGYGKRDFIDFCKLDMPRLLQVVNGEIVAAEKEMLKIAENIPFCPCWQETAVSDCERLTVLLETSGVFFKTHEDGGGFLFLERDNPSRLSWGYILFESNRAAVCVPPHEEPTPVLEALGRVIPDSAEFMDFKGMDSTHERYLHYNERMIKDLSIFLQNHEEMIDDILLPRHYDQYDQDETRSDFFTKLSFLLGKYLHSNKTPTEESRNQ